MKSIPSRLLAVVCSFFLFTNAQAQSISTVAGNGSFAYSGDGGPATSASMQFLTGLATDNAGNLYISDMLSSVVRKVNSAGIISTVAGNGGSGYTGDGGSATSAMLNYPAGLATDAAGNLYIADQANSVIRKVTLSGTISTVAGNGVAGYSGDGGAATAASIGRPSSVAIDALGNLYITDLYPVVRKVNAAGIISTIAGNSTTASYSGDGGPAIAALLKGPSGIAVDGSGNIYIADALDSRIRKIDGSGIISTLVGNGMAGYTGDGGPATAAALSSPYAVATDAVGNVYIGDYNNARVRKVNSTGIISTVAGNGGSGYAGDGGPATAAAICSPRALASDVVGNIYLAGVPTPVVRKVSNPFAGTNKIQQANVSLFPNPATDQLIIENAASCILTIHDMVGRELINIAIPGSSYVADISALSKGVFIVQITDGNGEKRTEKLIKQ